FQNNRKRKRELDRQMDTHGYTDSHIYTHIYTHTYTHTHVYTHTQLYTHISSHLNTMTSIHMLLSPQHSPLSSFIKICPRKHRGQIRREGSFQTPHHRCPIQPAI